MTTTMQVELDARATDEIRKLASVLHKTPEEALDEAVASGIHMLRRYAFYAQNAGSVTPEQGLEILRSAGVGNAPDPWDVMPEDLRAYFEKRSA